MFSYYSHGLVEDQLVATAKDPSTIPQQFSFLSQTRMRSQNISIGWKHYFKGAYNIEEGWSLYGTAGFGLLLGRVKNQYAVNIDTSLYSVDGPVNGDGNYRRLTLDLGAGWEYPLGNDLFLYSELRAFLPTTDYPTEYLKENGETPILGMICVGIRILFGNY